MIENFDSMLAASLQLEEPWYVSGASFDPEKQQMNIWVKVRDNAVFACPRCGSQAKRYGYEPYERSWRHVDCLFFPCYVHCQRPKVLCEKCGAQQINVDWKYGDRSREINAEDGLLQSVIESSRSRSRLTIPTGYSPHSA